MSNEPHVEASIARLHVNARMIHLDLESHFIQCRHCRNAARADKGSLEAMCKKGPVAYA